MSPFRAHPDHAGIHRDSLGACHRRLQKLVPDPERATPVLVENRVALRRSEVQRSEVTMYDLLFGHFRAELPDLRADVLLKFDNGPQNSIVVIQARTLRK